MRIFIGIIVVCFLLEVDSYAQDRVDGILLPEIKIETEQSELIDRSGEGSALGESLQFNPLVEVQSRGAGQYQADLSIQGSTFESVGVQLNGVGFTDTQTGHYNTELPIPVGMLEREGINTGFANAFLNTNAAVGSVVYGFRNIIDAGSVGVGGGEYEFNSQSVSQGITKLVETEEGQLNAEVYLTRTDSSGSLADTDYNNEQFATRMEWLGTNSKTDVLYGFQDKSYSWYYLYAPEELHQKVNSSGVEQDSLKTNLVLINHEASWLEDGKLVLTGLYRRNYDDYEFDRYNPGLFNPYQHTTNIYNLGVIASKPLGGIELNLSARALFDDIDSTALVFGPYNSKNIGQFGLLPKKEWKVDNLSQISFQAGANVFTSNRYASELLPLSRLEYRIDSSSDNFQLFYLEYSQSAQAPSYTAISSNPDSGLFRGNPNLGLANSSNYELGYKQGGEMWQWTGLVFYRHDQDVVDWVYDSALGETAARLAKAVDLDSFGFQSILNFKYERVGAELGYTFIDKNEDDKEDAFDSSYYALNYARHLLSGSVAVQITEEVSMFFGQQFKDYRANLLRGSNNLGYLSIAGLTYRPMIFSNVEFKLESSNLWDDNFEDVPGVPAAARQTNLFMNLYW